jgi:hypothetical protein
MTYDVSEMIPQPMRVPSGCFDDSDLTVSRPRTSSLAPSDLVTLGHTGPSFG